MSLKEIAEKMGERIYEERPIKYMECDKVMPHFHVRFGRQVKCEKGAKVFGFSKQ